MQKEGRVRGSGSGACATGAQTLREFFRQEVRPELRAVAALQLWLVGPQFAILNGVVSLLVPSHAICGEFITIIATETFGRKQGLRVFCDGPALDIAVGPQK